MNAKQFVRHYRAVHYLNGTYDDLMKRTGLSHAAISSRVARYRKKGVDLPQLKHRPKRTAINAEELNKPTWRKPIIIGGRGMQ